MSDQIALNSVPKINRNRLLKSNNNFYMIRALADAGWSSLAARRAHNPKVVGSNPAPATK